MKTSSRRRRRSGFTLIEVLLVLTILVILAALVVTNYSKVFGASKAQAAKIHIAELETAVNLYNFNVGNYPPNLGALLQPQGDAGGNWKGPYVKNEQKLNDEWGRPFQYASPGSHGQDFDIWTEAPDGQVIGSWD